MALWRCLQLFSCLIADEGGREKELPPGRGEAGCTPELVIIPVGPILPFLNGTGALALPVNYKTDVQGVRELTGLSSESRAPWEWPALEVGMALG